MTAPADRPRDKNGHFLSSGKPQKLKVHGIGVGRNSRSSISDFTGGLMRVTAKTLIPVSVEVMSQLDRIIEIGLEATDLEVRRLRDLAKAGEMDAKDRIALNSFMDMLGKFKRTELAAMQIERSVEEKLETKDVENAIKAVSKRLKDAGMLDAKKAISAFNRTGEQDDGEDTGTIDTEAFGDGGPLPDPDDV